MCPTQIDARGVQTVQTDSALTTWFGRPDFRGVITDDSVKWLKWGKNLPTRLWQLCRVSFRAVKDSSSWTVLGQLKKSRIPWFDRSRAMPASERYRLPWGRKLILVAFIAADFVNLACRPGYLCCRCGDFSGNLSEEYPTSSLGSSQLWENELNKSSI
jgi:hypothetical protein